MNELLATCYSEKEKNDVLNSQGRALEEEKMRLQDEEEKLMAIAAEVKYALTSDEGIQDEEEEISPARPESLKLLEQNRLIR